MTTAPTIHHSRFADLTPRMLYDVLALRADVFVVEQDCAYLDLDGRDHEPMTEHFWIEEDGAVVAAARLLQETDERWSIGRIVTHPSVRNRGLASAILLECIARARELGATTITLGGQSQLAEFYRGFGFETNGPEYIEDGIPHVPMRLTLDGE